MNNELLEISISLLQVGDIIKYKYFNYRVGYFSYFSSKILEIKDDHIVIWDDNRNYIVRMYFKHFYNINDKNEYTVSFNYRRKKK